MERDAAARFGNEDDELETLRLAALATLKSKTRKEPPGTVYIRKNNVVLIDAEGALNQKSEDHRIPSLARRRSRSRSMRRTFSRSDRSPRRFNTPTKRDVHSPRRGRFSPRRRSPRRSSLSPRGRSPPRRRHSPRRDGLRFSRARSPLRGTDQSRRDRRKSPILDRRTSPPRKRRSSSPNRLSNTECDEKLPSKKGRFERFEADPESESEEDSCNESLLDELTTQATQSIEEVIEKPRDDNTQTTDNSDKLDDEGDGDCLLLQPDDDFDDLLGFEEPTAKVNTVVEGNRPQEPSTRPTIRSPRRNKTSKPVETVRKDSDRKRAASPRQRSRVSDPHWNDRSHSKRSSSDRSKSERCNLKDTERSSEVNRPRSRRRSRERREERRFERTSPPKKVDERRKRSNHQSPREKNEDCEKSKRNESSSQERKTTQSGSGQARRKDDSKKMQGNEESKEDLAEHPVSKEKERLEARRKKFEQKVMKSDQRVISLKKNGENQSGDTREDKKRVIDRLGITLKDSTEHEEQKTATNGKITKDSSKKPILSRLGPPPTKANVKERIG